MKNALLFALTLVTTSLSAQNWTRVSDILAGVHHPVTFGIGNYGYSATGSNFSGAPTKAFYKYDPSSDLWTIMSDFPGTARSFAIGTVYDSKGYLGFGASQFSYLNDLWSYDPVADNWTQLASCPCAGRRHPSFIAVDSAIYVGLGDGQAGNLKDWWKYSIPNDSWTSLPDLPGLPRHHPFHFSVNGQVYAGLGHGSSGIYADWYKLDVSNDTWTAMQNFPGEARVAGTQINHADKGYVLSGDGDDHGTMLTGQFWEYEHSTDSWTQLTAHPGYSRWAPGSFLVNDTLYFFGGLNRRTNTLEISMYAYPMTSTVGLEESEQHLNLYPNPASDWVRIESNHSFDQFRLINAQGQMIMEEKASKQLDLSGLSPGIYFLQVIRAGQTIGQQKLLKQ